MYVKRCGFYVDNKCIVRKDVWIEWDTDMRKEDRYLYANKIKEALGREFNPIVDTTTASTNYLGKKLSAYWNNVEGMNCIEAYNEFIEQYDKEKQIPGIFEYIYYLALSDSSLNYIKSVRTFSNMFYNPDKGGSCDALACCALQLLIGQNKFDYIMDVVKLSYWCYSNIGTMRIVHAGKKPVEVNPVETYSYGSDYDDDELPFS